MIGSNKPQINIFQAIKNGDLAAVKSVMAKNPDVINETNEDNETPLHFAAKYGHTVIAQTIIDAGANLDAFDICNYTPLLAACENNKTQTALSLINAHADVNLENDDSITPLHWAAFYGNLAIVQALIHANANVNAVTGSWENPVRDRENETPLHLAALYGHADVVNDLIAAHADLDAVDADDNTPLHMAYEEACHSTVAQTLINADADVNVVNNCYFTPLHLAASWGDIASVRLLLNRHANINAIDEDGNTPMMDARDGNHLNIVRLFQEHGALLPEQLQAQWPNNRGNIVPNNIGGPQSAHNPAVHLFASKGARGLQLCYANKDIAQARQECIEWINNLSDDILYHNDAKAAISWIKNRIYVDNGGVNCSNVSLKDLIGLVWLGIHDKSAIEDKTLTDNDIDERKKTLLIRFHDIQHAYERSRNQASCSGGAFNMLISTLSGGHRCVNFIFISPETITFKAVALMKKCWDALDKDAKKRIAALWTNTRGAPEVFMNAHHAQIEINLRAEFDQYKEGVLDSRYNNVYERSIEGAVEALRYSAIPHYVKAFRRMMRLENQLSTQIHYNNHHRNPPRAIVHHYNLRSRGAAAVNQTSQHTHSHDLRARRLHAVRKR